MQQFISLIVGLVLAATNYLGLTHPMTLSDLPVIPPAPMETTTPDTGTAFETHTSTGVASTTTQTSVTATSTAKKTQGLSQDELLAMASNAFADGSVPLGDNKYVTDAPKKGYVYLCNAHKDNPGSIVNGPWMSVSTWNYLKKVSVSGEVQWPNAEFSEYVSGAWHMLSGNGLPVGFTTGVFPVASTDDAYKYDRNPNSIKTQMLSQKLPVSPVYSDASYCMGGEIGVMTDGVPLFNAFDAGLRDAPAHELQDSCDGHPQGSGEYHYHSLSACFKDISVSTVLGYALDGFPITGPEVAPGKSLTTDDLDVCHGITSNVKIDGKEVMTYHYVMTRDFPYSASCFRAKPVSLFVIAGAGPQGQQSQAPSEGQTQNAQLGGPPPGGGPPQVAIDACTYATTTPCSFTDANGPHSGTCQRIPDGRVACAPH